MNINQNKLPKSIGIIMDGNRRWAKKRGMPADFGHRQGVEAIKRVIKLALEFKIKVLSLFAFSTENWKRNKSEIDGIFNLVREYLENQEEKIFAKDVKLVVMGDTTKIPQDLQAKLNDLIKKSQNNEKLILNLGINYGGREEIVHATRKIVESGVKDIDEKVFSENLYTNGLPDPDLVIRTSGEQRLSGFMLFQCAYSEIYFEKTNWPGFKRKHFIKALKFYSKRKRRFGGN